MKRSAFTLIELLVVIAIIAILASIAIPVFGRAQEKSRAVQCASNLRQLGIGMQAYLNDHDDDFFPKSPATGGPWPKQLKDRYVATWKVFRSPFDRISAERPDVESGASLPVSYGINTNVFDVNSSKFTAPSELIVAAPAVDPASGDPKFSGLSSANVELPLPSGGAGKKLGTHQNRSLINALFADSHVNSLLYNDFSQSSSEAGKRRWFPDAEK
jgi:prepilin-type N-terminal cleavage/methylation domain-containing protein/prepilin-type processing-associated H-X9-DG protein